MPEKLDRCVRKVMDSKRMKEQYPSAKVRRSHAFAICNTSVKGGDMDYGYMIQLSEVDFAKPIHAMSLGKKQHPIYGEIDITPERIQRFADNVNNRTRGIDLEIDYRHKANDDKAAGWIKAAEVQDDGLYLSVEWTPQAQQAIKDKEFRYFSPEFYDEWTDGEGKTHSDIIAGGALTNRPFLKDLAPINFGDHAESDRVIQLDEGLYRYKKDSDSWARLEEVDDPLDKNEGGKMDEFLKKLAESMGVTLSEEPTDEETAKVLEEVGGLISFKEAATKDDVRAKKFEEDYPEIAEQRKQEVKRLEELESHNKLMEVDGRVNEWKRGKNAISPAAIEKIKEVRLDLDGDLAVKFDEAIQEIRNTGLVELSTEDGGGDDPTETEGAAKFEEEIEKKLKEKKDEEGYDYAKALEETEAEYPELARAYLKNS